MSDQRLMWAAPVLYLQCSAPPPAGAPVWCRKCSSLVLISSPPAPPPPQLRSCLASIPPSLPRPLFFSHTGTGGSFCGSASELHGRHTGDEWRRTRRPLQSAAEGNSPPRVPLGGLGAVRLGLQGDGEECAQRLRSGKTSEIPHS